MQVSAQEVEAAVKKSAIHRLVVHHCSVCGYPCAYLFNEGPPVVYDPGCDCTGDQGVEPRSFQDIADWVNMQSNEQFAEDIWQQITGATP